jgi:ATP-dependent Lhr-like helicase
MTNSLIEQWFKLKKWKPLPFQNEVWKQFFLGKSGLVCVPTGAGKTYAAYLAALSQLHESPHKGIQILYITPLRALAKDLEIALKAPIEDLKLPYRVERRTGDTSYTKKDKQIKNPPHILITTPESLAIMLCQKEAAYQFTWLQSIIVDEWHELLASKRGVLFELCLSRLKAWKPTVQIWGLTATIGNLEQAAQVCVGVDREPTIIQAHLKRETILTPIIPNSLDKLSWTGKLGLHLFPEVLNRLDPLISTIIFTNTRSQSERWYQAIIEAKPEWKNFTAIHHSSIDKKMREKTEEGIKSGDIRFLVCTSSLDLGIDLPSVEKVIQIGSPKSVTRLLQRAGRSSHRPLTPCQIEIVPTHALELIEIKAYRLAINEHLIENRIPLKKCYDVLMQHMMTCAIGGGFRAENLFSEIKTTTCFQELTVEEFEGCLQFLVSGGRSLEAYSEYKKLVLINGQYQVEDKTLMRRHKMSIGTISSDSHISVKWAKGKTLGMIEESFLMNLNPGDCFLFGGKQLELVQYRDMTAYVRLSKRQQKHTAVWKGSRLPFSSSLGIELRKVCEEKAFNKRLDPEDFLLQQIIQIQEAISYLPSRNELLIESVKSREGWHLFVYPFEGKIIHQGLALLMAYRLSKDKSQTFTISTNDYGFELLSRKPYENEFLTAHLFSPDHLQVEVRALINMTESGKKYFRDIARIAGLIFPGYPQKHKSNRQVQMSSSLLYDVLQKYDSDNLLLVQANKEVLDRQLEEDQLVKCLTRLSKSKLVIKSLRKFSPFGLGLFVERISDVLSTESLIERIEQIQKSWR